MEVIYVVRLSPLHSDYCTKFFSVKLDGRYKAINSLPFAVPVSTGKQVKGKCHVMTY